MKEERKNLEVSNQVLRIIKLRNFFPALTEKEEILT